MEEFSVYRHTLMAVWPGTVVLLASIFVVARSEVKRRGAFLLGLSLLLVLNLFAIAFTEWLWNNFDYFQSGGYDAVSVAGLLLEFPHAIAIGICVYAFVSQGRAA